VHLGACIAEWSIHDNRLVVNLKVITSFKRHDCEKKKKKKNNNQSRVTQTFL
jgi:hypothetical protein